MLFSLFVRKTNLFLVVLAQLLLIVVLTTWILQVIILERELVITTLTVRVVFVLILLKIVRLDKYAQLMGVVMELLVLNLFLFLE